MAQFTCGICGAEFEQKSRFERHLMTSHPTSAPTAADLEKALKGINFPTNREGLVAAAKPDQEIVAILRELPDQEYRDAAEVARAFGETRSHQKKPDYQPSRKGGTEAMKAPSAAKIASIFSGVDFPASGEELKEYARKNAGAEEAEVVERFGDHTFRDMADIAKELGRVS